MNQDISRMYRILIRKFFSCLDTLWFLYEILLAMGEAAQFNEEFITEEKAQYEPNILFSTQRVQNLTLIKRLAKRDTIPHTDITLKHFEL